MTGTPHGHISVTTAGATLQQRLEALGAEMAIEVLGEPEVMLRSILDDRCFTLSGAGPWRLGRGAEAEICFADDPGCSRMQASIARTSTGYSLAALSLSVPTALNNRFVKGAVTLGRGMVISFASQRLVLQSDNEMTVKEEGPAALTQHATQAVIVKHMAPQGRMACIPIGQGISLGRQVMPGQTVLDHPAISRRHTAIENRPGGIVLRDLGRTNGTFVNGVRVADSRRLKIGDRVDLGPFQLLFDGQGMQSSTRFGNAELTAIGINKDVRTGAATPPLRLLHNVSLKIRARSLVCIIGASGSGKSTLMNIRAGRSQATAGAVELNGQDLHKNFIALKQDAASVPQQDVLHEQLTTRQALDYAALLRLPPDTSDAQRKEIVEAAARSVDLFERLDTRIDALSGGQKKRASLASETMCRGLCA